MPESCEKENALIHWHFLESGGPYKRSFQMLWIVIDTKLEYIMNLKFASVSQHLIKSVWFQAKWVHDAIELLKGKTGVYIYISSDAVYEVSKPKTSDRPSSEEDAVRPEDREHRRTLINADRYGDAKLSGEEALVNQQSKKLFDKSILGPNFIKLKYFIDEEGGFPWVALRLADVYGPR